MSLDPIADALVKIKNAFSAGRRTVTLRFSNMNRDILEIMKKNKYIIDYTKEDRDGKSSLGVKFNMQLPRLELKRVSSPGQRLYSSYKELKPVMNGYGLGIISTSQGVMTFKEAKVKKLGGEILAYIW